MIRKRIVLYSLIVKYLNWNFYAIRYANCGKLDNCRWHTFFKICGDKFILGSFQNCVEKLKKHWARPWKPSHFIYNDVCISVTKLTYSGIKRDYIRKTGITEKLSETKINFHSFSMGEDEIKKKSLFADAIAIGKE